MMIDYKVSWDEVLSRVWKIMNGVEEWKVIMNAIINDHEILLMLNNCCEWYR